MKMNLPRLKNILHKVFYNDRATVYRNVEVIEEDTGASDYEFQAVYENIPCHLAQYGKDIAGHRDDRAYLVTEDLRLTCNPEIEIQENDVVEVLHEGEIFKLWAGTSFNYPTHKEISLRRRKEAKQE